MLMLIALLASPVNSNWQGETIAYSVKEDGAIAAPASNRKGKPMVAGLPYARGKSFSDLDGYLRHLQSNAAVDLPWWREIRPGVYEHVKSLRGAPPEIATRAELMKKFGFSK